MKENRLVVERKSRILDIGCGSGMKDDATHFLDRIKWFPHSNFMVWNLEVLPLPYEDGYFDKIYCDNVLEHLDGDTISLLKELRRVLKLKGRLIIKVPNSMYIGHRVSYMLGRWPEDAFKPHVKHFTFQSMVHCINEAGMKPKYLANKRLFLLPEMFTNELHVEAMRFD